MAVIPIEIIILGLGYLMIFVSLALEKVRIFKYLGAILIFVIGVWLLYPGVTGIPNTGLIALALGSISIVLGFYFMVEDSLSFDKQADSYDQFHREERVI